MSLRERYLKIVLRIAPAGLTGASLLLGSPIPGAANPDPLDRQPKAAQEARVSERLAAIRDAVTTAAALQPDVNKSADSSKLRLAWGNWWRNWGWWRPWGWGWPNWNNWRNWNNWPNWWRNF
jgi:hypothetical protein